MQIALKRPRVIIGLAIALLLSGIFAFSQIDIEAYPDPVQPMIEVLTLPNGLSAEEVEQLVTVPLEYALARMRNLEAMRSISLFGLSDIRCYFSWDSDYYWDRRRDHQPASVRHPSAGRHGRHLARESDRRNLPLHGRES